MLDIHGIEANKRALLNDLRQLIEEALEPFADALREFLEQVRAGQFGSHWRGAWQSFVETQAEAGFNIDAESVSRLEQLMEDWERAIATRRSVTARTCQPRAASIIVGQDEAETRRIVRGVSGYDLFSARVVARGKTDDKQGGSAAHQNPSDRPKEFRFRVYDIARRGAEDQNKVIGDLKLTLKVDVSPCMIDTNGRCHGRVFLSLFFDWAPQTVHPEQNPLSTGSYMLSDDTHSVPIVYLRNGHSFARFPIVQPKLASPVKTPCTGFTLDRVLRVYGVNTTSLQPAPIDLFRIRIHVEVGPCGKKGAQHVTFELSNQLLNAGVRPPDEI
ncbi:MAG TPA: hypothetical protein VL175_18655 [Pirellulales bacterium]|jgi:hypothetical protein|nr:hypothetical protein [Pirellulales bacterium]